MAEEQTEAGEELSKATWHYIGVGTLWISLILSGVAFERLGLTTDILTGLLPGEVNSLRIANAAFKEQVQDLKDKTSRLDGLVGREAATAEAHCPRVASRVRPLPAP